MSTTKTILIHPIISEKSVLNKELGKYVFKVSWDANKSEIKKAVEDKFKVKVDKVNTVKVPGKSRKMGKYMGMTSHWKKAIVTLTDGQKIQELENI
ncbi:MAG: 50S ribosomal protein L23 [Atribacterota bacterium]|nr:50S ribosomal protein L23 [Atribacterota bacterium]